MSSLARDIRGWAAAADPAPVDRAKVSLGRRSLDLRGAVFGELTAEECVGTGTEGHVWRVRCSGCGASSEWSAAKLRRRFARYRDHLACLTCMGEERRSLGIDGRKDLFRDLWEDYRSLYGLTFDAFEIAALRSEIEQIMPGSFARDPYARDTLAATVRAMGLPAIQWLRSTRVAQYEHDSPMVILGGPKKVSRCCGWCGQREYVAPGYPFCSARCELLAVAQQTLEYNEWVIAKEADRVRLEEANRDLALRAKQQAPTPLSQELERLTREGLAAQAAKFALWNAYALGLERAIDHSVATSTAAMNASIDKAVDEFCDSEQDS